MHVKRKLNKVVDQLLVSKGFVKERDLIYGRTYKGVPQWITFDIHKSSKHISVYARTNLFMEDRYYSKLDYYFYGERVSLDECLEEIKESLVQEIFPKMEEVSNSFTITIEMQDKVKHHREPYVKKYLDKFQTFPVTLEELIENIKKVYEEMDGENEEEIKEGICLSASVYTEYLMKKYVFDGIVGLEKYRISFGLDMNSMLYRICPLNIAYAVYFTKHFEAFVYGEPIYYLGINGEWKFTEPDYSHVLE